MKKLFGLLFILISFTQINLNAQQKDFGLGIILGEPTGVSGKLWTSSENAFDFAAAWSFSGRWSFLCTSRLCMAYLSTDSCCSRVDYHFMLESVGR